MLFAGVRVEWGPCGVEGMCGVGGSARPCEHPGRAVCPKVAPTSTLPLGLSTHGRTHLGACQELGEEIPPISGHPRNQGRLGGGPHLWDTTGWGLHCGTHKGGGSPFAGYPFMWVLVCGVPLGGGPYCSTHMGEGPIRDHGCPRVGVPMGVSACRTPLGKGPHCRTPLGGGQSCLGGPLEDYMSWGPLEGYGSCWLGVPIAGPT